MERLFAHIGLAGFVASRLEQGLAWMVVSYSIDASSGLDLGKSTIFPPPAKTSGWAVEGTFGERLFLDQRGLVAASHARPVAILTAMTMLGMVLLLTGLFILNPWIALWGMTIAMGAKLWIVDRMVWLYRESRHNLGS